MRRPLVIAIAAVLALAACGSSSDGGSAAPAPAPGISGTVLGQPFTAVDSSALALSSATCAFAGVNANATGLLLGFGSFQGLCSFVTQNQVCADKANATIVTVLLVRATVPGGTAGPVQPGTFTLGGATPTPDAQGNVTVAEALLSKTDGSCAEPPSAPTVTSGTVKITAVGARTTGSVDLTFSDGGHVSGAFDVPTCTGLQLDTCTALAGGNCATRTCVP